MKNYLIVILCSVFFLITSSGCKNEWRSPDGYTEKQILEFGYKTGYEVGNFFNSFGSYHKPKLQDIKEFEQAAANDYFGNIVTSEDNRVHQLFKDEFYEGVYDAMNGKTMKQFNK